MTQQDQQPLPGIPEVPAKPETVQVEDLDTFVRLLVAWHQEKCAMVQHLLQVPDGAAFEIGDGPEKKDIVLTGAMLEGFKFGIEMTMMQLGTLPFAAEVEATANAAG